MENVFFQTFIDIEKWNRAGWKATVFFYYASGGKPPSLGIVFEDIDIGKQIFSDWRCRLGNTDEYEELRISIVEGEILSQGAGYSVHISSDPSHTVKRARANGSELDLETMIIGTESLIHRMKPEPGSPHLPRFKQDFAKHKKYFLIPVSAAAKPQFEVAIEKTEVLFRQASEITKGDEDAAVFPEHYFDRDDTIQ